MNIYWVIGKYVAVALIGAAGCYWAYAIPRVAALKEASAKAEAAAAKERSTFLEGARNEQVRLQGLVDAANRAADDARMARDRAAFDLAAANARLRNANSTLSNYLTRLPEAASCPVCESSAATLGDVEQRMADFGGRCSAEVERLGDSVRYYEEAFGVKK